MPCFLSPPGSPLPPPLSSLSSFQSPRSPPSRFSHPSLPRQQQQQKVVMVVDKIHTRETLKPPGKPPPSPLSSLARCSSDNRPTMTPQHPRVPLFTEGGGGGGGGVSSPSVTPAREEGRFLECGRPVLFPEKNISLPSKGAGDVSSASKASILLTRAVATSHSVEEVGMLPPVQVAESPGGLVEEMSPADTNAGATEVAVKDGDDEITGVPSRERSEIACLVDEMGSRPPGDPLQKLGCSGRRGAPTVECLTDRVRSLCCGELCRDLLRKRGAELLTISDVNELLLTLVRHGEFESAMSLFAELPSYGLSPNSWSFSIMTQYLCKKNEPDKAMNVLYDMMRNGFSPTTVLFTTVIHCFCKKGRLQSAYELFETMGRMGCHPTVQTYNCLINGLCYVGRIEEAFQLLKKIKESAAEPDVYTFTTVIDGFCKVGRTDEAIEMLNDALELGVQPNVVTFNSLINGFCREGRPLEGVGLLRDMKGGGCQPDHISYGTLLQGLLKCGEVSAALKIYEEMREVGLKVEERVMNTLLRGICRMCTVSPELLKEAEGLFETIINMGYGLSPYTYCLMVQAFAIGGHTSKALAHLNQMERIGYSPRTMTCNIAIRVLCNEGRVDDALLVLILMVKGNRIPSTFSCNRLLSEFNRQERHLDACSVYAAALKQGVSLCQEPRKQSKEQKGPLPDYTSRKGQW